MSKITFTEVSSTPAAPSSGQVSMYVKTDEVLYIQDSLGVEIPLGSATSVTSLTGDVTGTGPGATATTVVSVGGSSAANVHSAELAANSATASNTASTIVKRDSSGNFSAGIITANLTGIASNATLAANTSNVGSVTASQVVTSVTATQNATSSNTASTLVSRDASGNFSANIITANLSGNATTATSAGLFTGSLSGDVTGTQSATVVAYVDGSTAVEVHTSVLATQAATSINTASTIVERDASGNFSANNITSNVTGNLLGNVTGNVTGNLLGNVTGNVSGSSASFTGSLSGDVTGTQTATVVSTVGGSSASNVHSAELAANAATNANTASTIVKRDSSGNFSAGTITATLTGSASNNVLKAGDTMAGNLVMGSNKVTSSATPSSANDLTNKAYVDAYPAINGLQNSGYSLSPVYGSISNTVTQGNDSRLSATNRVNVKQNPGAGEFSSIAAAIASITTASPTNPFDIWVQPGVYVEAPFTLKANVNLTGLETSSVILVASNPNVAFITGIDGVSITNLTITGANGTNGIGIFHQGTLGSALEVANVTFSNCTTCISTTATGGNPSQLLMSNPIFNTPFTTGILATTDGASVNQILVDRLIAVTNTAPYATDIAVAHGVGLLIDFTNSQIFNPTGNGIRVYDGATLIVNGLGLAELSKGIWVQNTGTAPTINVIGIQTLGNTKDIQIDHPGTLGSIDGSFNANTSTIASPYIVLLASNVDGSGITFTGDLTFGPNFATKVDVTSLVLDAGTMGVYSGGALTSGGGFIVDVAAGTGYLSAMGSSDTFVTWNNTSITLTANTSNYIFFDSSSILTASSGFPDTRNTILLGRVVTNGSGIEFIDKSPVIGHHYSNLGDNLLRQAIGPIFQSGCIVTEDSTPLHLDVSSGSYFFGNNQFQPSTGTNISFDAFYRNGSGGWTISNTNLIDVNHYDDSSGTLASIPSNNYVSHSLYVVGDGSSQKYLLVYGQTTYSTLVQAQNGNIPASPTYFNDGVVLLASIIVKQGATSIIAGGGSILDNRPVIGFSAPQATASLVHGNLLGLSADDHHQYLLVTGTRAMSGNLDIGGNNVINVNQVDGVVVHAHESRHLPNGADPLTTAAPTTNLDSTTTNAVGIQNSLARSDHSHAISTGVVSTQNADQTNAAGSSANLAKADHVHNIPTDVPVSTGSANAQGSSIKLAKADHVHNVITASGLQNISGTLSPVYGTPVNQTPDQTNTTGSSNQVAMADHIHDIPTGAASGLDSTSTNTQGSAAAFTRQDHTHHIASGVVSTQIPDQTNATGSSANFAKADHIHNIPSATPVQIGTSNNRGSAASFALSDHVHALTASVTTGQLLTGYTTGSNTPITSSNSILTAFENLQSQVSATVGAAITSLTSDVSATGPGASSATVNSVGGSSASNIHAAELAANAATNLNTVSTIIKRDASGDFQASGILLMGSTSGSVDIGAAATTSTYTINMPASQGSAGSYISNDGSGNLSWTNPLVNIDGGSPTSNYVASQYISGGTP